MEWKNFPKEFYAYLAGIMILFLASGYYQYKRNVRKDLDML